MSFRLPYFENNQYQSVSGPLLNVNTPTGLVRDAAAQGQPQPEKTSEKQ